MLELLQYNFILRGLETGLVIALVAPLIGIFLVLRRYSLIADALSHISLAGVAIGLLLGVNPIITALISTFASSVVIEKLRLSKKVYGESALSLFLSGSLALAVVLISVTKGFSVDIFNYLFGSLVTVTVTDAIVITAVGASVAGIIFLFYKELVYTTFDEEAAKVSGLPTNAINLVLITLTALTVALAIPIVGILLISALMVIPFLAALQFHRSFIRTLIYAEIISVVSVISGIFIAFSLNLSTGGTIVLVTITLFGLSLAINHKR